MSIFSALIRTVTSPLEVGARTIKNLAESDFERPPIIGDFIKAVGDTAKNIVDEFEE